MMYSYLLLSTAQAFPTVHVTECRETLKAQAFDKKADYAVKAVDSISKGYNKLVGDDKLNPNTGELSFFKKNIIKKIVNDLGDHARPLLFERVECKDGSGPDFQPCSDLYGKTVCEQVALRKMQDRESDITNIFNKKSTCKAIDRMDATAVSVDFLGDFAMTCNMEDSLESMDLYVKGYIRKTPECPEGLQLEDPKMKKAVYDKEKQTFTLTTGFFKWATHEDVTEKVKCIRKPREEVAQEVKDNLVSKLDWASKLAPAPFDDHFQTLEEELKKMTPEEILVHYDELMADPAAKMMEFTSSQIAKDIAEDIAKKTVSSTTEKAKDKANEALEKLKQHKWVQENPDLADIITNVQENDVVEKGLDQLRDAANGFLSGWLR